MYGSETRRIKEQVKIELEATEIDALRQAARTSRLERIRNETIKEGMSVQKTIINCIEEEQLIWYGHIQRMGQDRLPKKSMRLVPRERRQKERPKETWIAVSYTHLHE